MATWRLPPALKKLRDECNALAPNRSKASDGSIGDSSHAARKSDHNPDRSDPQRDINAIDITNDPKHGLDFDKLLPHLLKDKRVIPAGGYYIFKKRIYSPVSPKGRAYKGSNPHDKHCHVSIGHAERVEEDTSPWLPGGKPNTTPPAPTPVKHSHPTELLKEGMGGSYVKDVQRHLNALTKAGKLPGPALVEDGDFGPKTERRVIDFQLKRGLSPDGVVGKLTWAELHKGA